MDPVHFSGKEILEMAVRIEENGFKFYTEAANASGSKEIKGLFTLLASEETEHIKVFMGLHRLISGTEPSTEGYDPEFEEASQYLKAIADTEVFTNPNKGRDLGRATTDANEALNLALNMEKDSILFYHELQRMIREKDKAVLDNVIEQEKEHVRRLTDLKIKLSGR